MVKIKGGELKMNKLGRFSGKTGLGIAFIFSGLIIASQVNLIVGVVMVGLGIFLVSTSD